MIMTIIGVILYCASLFLLILLYLMRFEKFSQWYEILRMSLIKMEYFIASIEDLYLLIPLIIILFALKGYMTMFPTTTLCFISGMVLTVPQAFAVNMTGVTLMMLISYWKGKKNGGGNVSKLFTEYRVSKALFEKSENIRPLLLFAFRFLPLAPIKSISRLYGSMDFNLGIYLIISIGAYAPRVMSYTIIGRNIFDPLSSSFIMPLVILLMLSGTSVFIVNTILNFNHKRNNKKQNN